MTASKKTKQQTNRKRIRTLRRSAPPKGTQGAKRTATAKASSKRRTAPAPRRRTTAKAHSKKRTSGRKTPSHKTPKRGGKRGSKRQPPRRTGKKMPPRVTDGTHIPEPGDNLRVIPLGGVEQVGRNMTAIEYKDDIVIIDAGFEFAKDETPGIDYIIPDVTYLEERKHKIRGLYITHGHFDHIGAIPHIMERLGNPPIYTREFGALVIKKRQTDYPQSPELDVRVVQGTERIKAGEYISVRFFPISHAIRDAMGIIVETPVGNVAILTDVRVDNIDGKPTQEEIDQYEFFKNEKVSLFMLDSTKIEVPGFSPPESVAVENIGRIMKSVSHRLIIGTFSSQVERILDFIRLADKYNKKVVIDGRSMQGNVELMKQLGLITTKNLITIDQMKDYKPHELVILVTGAQGEEYSVLWRLASNAHRKLKLNKTDTLILSSSIVPGNEVSVQNLKDGLFRSGARIITYLGDKVHAGGHGSRGELEWIHSQIDYDFFMPMHGHHYMLCIHAQAARDLGLPKENAIVPEHNGAIIEITPDGKKIMQRKELAPAGAVMVDGFSVSNRHEVVLRDRQALAEDGIVVIVASLDPRTGKLRKSPDIIARGFVYVRESGHLLDETRAIVKRTVEKNARGMKPVNFDHIRTSVTDEVRKHLFKSTRKSPMVIPVIISV